MKTHVLYLMAHSITVQLLHRAVNHLLESRAIMAPCHLSRATGDKPGSLLLVLLSSRLSAMHQQHSSPQAQLKDLMDSTLTATQHPIFITLTSVETVYSSLGLDEGSDHTHNMFYAGFLCLHHRYWSYWVDGLLLFMLLLITCLWGRIRNKLLRLHPLIWPQEKREETERDKYTDK